MNNLTCCPRNRLAGLRSGIAALGVLGLLLLPVGCISTHMDDSAIIRAARDCPDHFLVSAGDSGRPTEPTAGTGCHSPMVDPRDGTQLLLRRSAAGQGDYVVPAGRYGIGPKELLRLDCATGKPLGVVKR
jgi:hypothetical protein